MITGFTRRIHSVIDQINRFNNIKISVIYDSNETTGDGIGFVNEIQVVTEDNVYMNNRSIDRSLLEGCRQ